MKRSVEIDEGAEKVKRPLEASRSRITEAAGPSAPTCEIQLRSTCVWLSRIALAGEMQIGAKLEKIMDPLIVESFCTCVPSKLFALLSLRYTIRALLIATDVCVLLPTIPLSPPPQRLLGVVGP